MPLIILGLIVVLGACLLIYYQLGPKVTRRLKSGQSIFGSVFGSQDGNSGNFYAAGAETDTPEADAGQDGAGKGEDDDGKVLFIFGDGEREERLLGEDGQGPLGEGSEHDENA